MTRKVNPYLFRLGVSQVHNHHLMMEKKNMTSYFWLYLFIFLKQKIAFLFDYIYYQNIFSKNDGILIDIRIRGSHWFRDFLELKKQKKIQSFKIEIEIDYFLKNTTKNIPSLNFFEHYCAMECISLLQTYLPFFIFQIRNNLKFTLNEIIFLQNIMNSLSLTVRLNLTKQPFYSAKVQIQQMIHDFNHLRLNTTIQSAIDRTKELKLPGMKIRIKGRLDGAERARSHYKEEGNVALRSLRSFIDYSSGFAPTKYGSLGIQLWIDKGNFLCFNDYILFSDTKYIKNIYHLFNLNLNFDFDAMEQVLSSNAKELTL